MNRILPTVIPFLLLGCAPLKRVQHHQQVDSLTVERVSLEQRIEKSYQEAGNLTQTIIEYYPPIRMDTTLRVKSPPLSQVSSHPPSVKRIVVTQIERQEETLEQTENTQQKRIDTSVTKESLDKVVEKPPAGVTWIKWGVAALVLLVIVILLIRF